MRSTWRRIASIDHQLGEARSARRVPPGRGRVARREARGRARPSSQLKAALRRAGPPSPRAGSAGEQRLGEVALAATRRARSSACVRPRRRGAPGTELARDRRTSASGDRGGLVRRGGSPSRCASPCGRNASSPAPSASGAAAPAASTHSPSTTRCARASEALAGTETHQGARAVASSITRAEKRARRRTSERASIAQSYGNRSARAPAPSRASVEVRGLRVRFLGKLGVDDLALGVGEERRAAVLAVLGREGARRASSPR